MPKFTYQGTEAAVEVFGFLFPRGQAVDVPEVEGKGAEARQRIIAKLTANPEFNPPVEKGDPGDGEPEIAPKGKKK